MLSLSALYDTMNLPEGLYLLLLLLDAMSLYLLLDAADSKQQREYSRSNWYWGVMYGSITVLGKDFQLFVLC